MVTKLQGGFLISCDHCSNEQVLREQDFPSAMDAARRKGWHMLAHADGAPRDQCPACAEESTKRARAQTAPLRFRIQRPR